MALKDWKRNGWGSEVWYVSKKNIGRLWIQEIQDRWRVILPSKRIAFYEKRIDAYKAAKKYMEKN